MTEIKGIYAASLSILDKNLALNIEKTIDHAENLINAGCHGVAIFGSTGQSQLISVSEKIQLINELSKSQFNEKYIIGTGLNSLSETINLNIPFFLILFYVVLLPGITSFFFWIKGVALIGANKAGIYLHLMPILATILAMLIYKEQIMFYHYIGAIFIISGIIFSNKKNV